MRINIILPYLSRGPGGGLKVMYQYANQLCENGHDVVIYHSSRTRWTQRAQKYFLYLIARINHFISGPVKKEPWWFPLSPNISSFEIPKVRDKYIRDADIIFSTWWATAVEVSNLSDCKGKKHNLIQDYEVVMTKKKELVHVSYQQPLNHIVIAKYLQAIVEQYSGKTPAVIPNAISHKQFYITVPIAERNRRNLIMMYSRGERKGTKFALDALNFVAKSFPDLKVTFFCAENIPPDGLSFNFQFYHKPDNLLELYNNASVFISPSIHEGWGLPAMEAMACGCACVCTNIEGHLDFMTDNKTALLVAPANPQSMANAIIELFNNDAARISIAEAAEQHIKSFTWQNSTRLLENQFQSFKS